MRAMLMALLQDKSLHLPHWPSKSWRSSCLPSAETSPPESSAGNACQPACPSTGKQRGPANTTPLPLAAQQRLYIRRRSTLQETVRHLAELEGLLHPKQVLQTNTAAAAVASRFCCDGGQGSALGGESAAAARCCGGARRTLSRNEVPEEAAILVWKACDWKLMADDAVVARLTCCLLM
jgi:hypothetical protein